MFLFDKTNKIPMVSFAMHFGFDQRRHCKAKWPHQSWIGADNFPAASFAEQVGDGLQEPGLSKKGMEVSDNMLPSMRVCIVVDCHVKSTPHTSYPMMTKKPWQHLVDAEGIEILLVAVPQDGHVFIEAVGQACQRPGRWAFFFNHPKIRVLGLGFIILNP